MLVFRAGSMLKVKSQKIGIVSDTLENISKIYKSSLIWIKEKKKKKETTLIQF